MDVVKPGEIIGDYMEAHDLGKTGLAHALGVSPEEMEAILQSAVPITRELALLLSVTFGRPATFWMMLEHQYNKQRTTNKEKA